MGALLSSFALVFGKAWQQQNVMHGQYVLAAVTSYMLAICEVAILLIVVDKGWPAVPWIGTGGALGVTCAMYAHKRWVQTESEGK